jgi:uncharacterized protein (TIGR00255 family)
MTGFGQAAGETARQRLAVTVQTYNHRHLDLSLRLPESLRARESSLRERVAARLARGRCELSIQATTLDPLPPAVRVHAQAVHALLDALRPLVAEGVVEARLSVGDLLRMPALVEVAAPEETLTAAETALAERLVDEALGQAVAARAYEGERLAAALERGLGELRRRAARLAARRGEVVARLAESLRERVSELSTGTGVNEERLAQEVALLADRSDVREELDRLQAHLEQFAAVAAEPGPIGRRLDFLVQEILRELNTLGAKCRDVEMTRDVIEAKGACEQLREQVQNVE